MSCTATFLTFDCCSAKLDHLALSAMMNAFKISRSSAVRRNSNSSPSLLPLIVTVMLRKGVDDLVILRWFYFCNGETIDA
jgi:hypothetical protein